MSMEEVLAINLTGRIPIHQSVFSLNLVPHVLRRQYSFKELAKVSVKYCNLKLTWWLGLVLTYSISTTYLKK